MAVVTLLTGAEAHLADLDPTQLVSVIGPPPTRLRPVAADPASSAEAWDAFVAASDGSPYLQTTGWAAVKAANGWRAHRLAIPTADGPVGAQVLMLRVRRLPWQFGYAPRGPVATKWTPEAIATVSEALRRNPGLVGQRLAHIRVDPPIERIGDETGDGELRRALKTAGWRSAPSIQPAASRVIDLTVGEPALWQGLRSKWRQYVSTAGRNGIRVIDAGGDGLPEFYRIYQATAARTGMLIRTEQAYRAVWDAFRPVGQARLLLAEDARGSAQAALFLVSCGARVVEPYGGMTAAGAASRANYLLKWEAIRSSCAAGFTSYDMWGLVNPGIDHFKAGFGGREVRYIGAWDLVLDPVGHAAIQVATHIRSAYVERVRRRVRRGGRSAAGSSRNEQDRW